MQECLLLHFLTHGARLNSLHRWPTVVVINAVYNMVTANLSVDQGHGSQLATIYLIAVQDVHPESLHSVIGDMALTSLQLDPSHFFQ